jgi:hypothetical protein
LILLRVIFLAVVPYPETRLHDTNSARKFEIGVSKQRLSSVKRTTEALKTVLANQRQELVGIANE